MHFTYSIVTMVIFAKEGTKFVPEQQPEGLTRGLAEGIGVDGGDDIGVLVDEPDTAFQTAQAALHAAQCVLCHLLSNKIDSNKSKTTDAIGGCNRGWTDSTTIPTILLGHQIHNTHTNPVVRLLELALEVRHDGSDRTYNGDQQGPEGDRAQVMDNRGANGLRKVGKHGQQHNKNKESIKYSQCERLID